jgi:hypothetical protein
MENLGDSRLPDGFSCFCLIPFSLSPAGSGHRGLPGDAREVNHLSTGKELQPSQ